MEDGDGEVHVVRHLDLQGAVLAFDDILFRDVCDGRLDTAAPLTLLRLHSFRDDLAVDILIRVAPSSVLVKRALKKDLGGLFRVGWNVFF